MLGSPVGLVVKDLSPENDAGRAALALAPRLLTRGFLPRLTAHRLAAAPPQDMLGPTLDMDTVGAWPFPAAWSAASFDRAARHRPRLTAARRNTPPWRRGSKPTRRWPTPSRRRRGTCRD